MLEHTYIHTNTGPTTFFQRPTRGNLRAKAFNAKALKPFYSTILNDSTTLTTAQENFNVEGLSIHRIEKIRRTTILTRI